MVVVTATGHVPIKPFNHRAEWQLLTRQNVTVAVIVSDIAVEWPLSLMKALT